MITKKISHEDFVQRVLQMFEQMEENQILSRGELLLREGQIDKYLYYIEQGAVKLYYLSEFEERIIRFGYDGSIINSLSSYLMETPSEFSIEAIRKTTVKRISKSKLSAVIAESPETIAQYCKFLETLLSQQIDREVDLMVSSPTQRLNRVLQRSPNLFQHIPLKYIASYLRMNPETLSRIRNS